MRSVQYGGEAIEQSNGRIYNCNSRFVDSTRAFSEIFLTLLWGNGAGMGLVNKYLNRLSDLLFVLCRVLNENGLKDILWIPGLNQE